MCPYVPPTNLYIEVYVVQHVVGICLGTQEISFGNYWLTKTFLHDIAMSYYTVIVARDRKLFYYSSICSNETILLHSKLKFDWCIQVEK